MHALLETVPTGRAHLDFRNHLLPRGRRTSQSVLVLVPDRFHQLPARSADLLCADRVAATYQAGTFGSASVVLPSAGPLGPAQRRRTGTAGG